MPSITSPVPATTPSNVSVLQEQRRRMLESSFLLSSRFPGLELRLRKERQLLFAQGRTLLACCIFLNYFVLVVFRNLVYFRNNPGMRPLRDLGHELLPEMGENALAESPMLLIFCMIVACSLGAFVGHDAPHHHHHSHHRPASRKPYFINALKRLVVTFSVGHFLRAFTYLSTNLPGPALHCQTAEYYDPPPTLASCFYRLVSRFGNCGDLNFSGHMFLAHLGTIFVAGYGRKFWSQPRFGTFHLATTGACFALSFVQMGFILAMRHHYTVDVVLATYVAPLLWSFLEEYMDDLEPDLGMIEGELVVESTWPKWLRIANLVFALVCTLLILLSVAFSFGGNFRLLRVSAGSGGDDGGSL